MATVEDQSLLMETLRKFLAGSTKNAPDWNALKDLRSGNWLSNPSPTDSLEALFLKALKKAPESFSSSALSILINLPSDIPSDTLIANGVLPLVLRIVKSNELLVRNTGANIIQELCLRITEIASFTTIFSSLLDALRGKNPGSSLTVALLPSQKLPVLLCLLSCMTTVKSLGLLVEDEEILLSYSEGLVTFIQKEEEQGLCLLAGRLLGMLLVSFGTGKMSFLENSRKFMDAALAGPRLNSRGAALFLASTFFSVQYAVSSNGFIQSALEALHKLFMESAGKNSFNIEHFIIAGLIVNNAASFSDLINRFHTTKGFSSALSNCIESIVVYPKEKAVKDIIPTLHNLHSYQCTEDMLQHLVWALHLEEQIISLTRLIPNIELVGKGRMLLSSSGEMNLSDVTEAGESFVRWILLGHVLGIPEVNALTATSVGLKDGGHLLLSIVWGVMKVLHAGGVADVELIPNRSLAGLYHSESNAVVTFSSHVLKAVIKVLMRSLKSHDLSTDWVQFLISSSFLSILTLLCGHPQISASLKAAKRLWAHIFPDAILNQKHGILPSTFGELAKRSTQKIFSLGSLSSDPCFRVAAERAVVILCDPTTALSRIAVSFAENVAEEYGQLIRIALRDNKAFSLNDDDVQAVFDCEALVEAEVIKKRVNGGNTSVNVEATNADRKKTVPRSSRKGNFGKDAEFEADWAERVAKEKEQKLKDSLSDCEAAIRKEANALVMNRRSEVLSLIAFNRNLVEALKVFSQLRSGLAEKACSIICANDDLWKLYTVILIGEDAQDIFSNFICSVLHPTLRDCARDISACLRMAAFHHYRFQFKISLEIANKYRCNREDLLQDFEELPSPFLRLFRVLNVLRSVAHESSESAISLSSFLVLYPILRNISFLKTNLRAVEMAFGLLKSLWSPDFFAENLVSDILMVCLGIQDAYPRGHLGADVFLGKVALQAAPLSAFALAPLVGHNGLLHADAKIRSTCGHLLTILDAEGGIENRYDQNLLLSMWIARCDEDVSVYEGVASFWSENRLIEFDTSSALPVFWSYLKDEREFLRKLAANAIAGLMSLPLQLDQLDSILSAIFEQYRENLPSRFASKADPLTVLSVRQRNKEPVDETITYRLSVAAVLESIGSRDFLELVFTERTPALLQILQFIVMEGVVDPSAEVRSKMQLAGVKIVAKQGKYCIMPLLSALEDILARKASENENLAEFDNRHAATIVLMGSVARHLDKTHPSLISILQLLVDSLKIPSESVQRSVSDCLVPIVLALKGSEVIDALAHKLLDLALQTGSYGERRGGAFGLAALIKGLGISSLKRYDLPSKIRDACIANAVSTRQGAMFVIECLAERLGILFEPYIINLMDAVLENFSHSSDHVREAANKAVKVILAKLSAHGIKQILGPVISSLDNNGSWKARQEAIKILGAMANCAPKQLSTCLPQIVPCLVHAGTDTHPKVRESAKGAMADISSVVRNPEIGMLCPVLLAAVGDPANKTKDALDALLKCEFIHTIDAPSFALLVPVLSRALKERSGDLKRKSAAITGNMIAMVSDVTVLVPYLSTLLVGLKDCLMDPIPDVRASGAKAMGSIFQGIERGASELQEALGWLLVTLQSVTSPVELSGAAQGLAEICSTYDDSDSRLTNIIQTVLGFKSINKATAREGLMWFLSFLPYSLKERFGTHVDSTLPIVLQGLSDDGENVREVAMRAGKVIIAVLGSNHAMRLAPALVQGVFSADWRIRLSSLQLLGDLLVLVGEVKPLNSAIDLGEEEVLVGIESSNILNNLHSRLGVPLTCTVLSALYIARSDIIISVRQHSLQIWKAVVMNTPRTLTEIMPTLVDILVEKLASPQEDMRIIAGKCIGELVSKLGDRVMAIIIPPLEHGLMVGDENTRLGVCSGLGEVLSSCTRKQAEDYIVSVIEAVEKAVCDPSSEVRSQAAQVFMILYKSVGPAAVDHIVPALLQTFQNSHADGELALSGLRQIVAQRPRELLDYLLPRLLVTPISASAGQALASVVEVSGQYLHYHLGEMLPALIHELIAVEDLVEKQSSKAVTERLEALQAAILSLLGALTDAGMSTFVSEIGKQLDVDVIVKRRRWGCWVVGQFFKVCKANFEEYLPVLLKYLLARVADTDQTMLTALKDCFTSMAGSVALDALAAQVEFIKNCITSAASSARHRVGGTILRSSDGEFLLPLFTLAKSLDPFFAIFSHGLLNGSLHVKEISAEMIAECASMAEVDVLKPTLLKVVGSLIRIIGDRYPSTVKASILQALIVLMHKGSTSLKAFVPQLQTTFVKSLNDPVREVRGRAGKALGQLLHLGPRVDSLLVDLTQLSLQSDSRAIKLSILEALGRILHSAGNKASLSSLQKVAESLQRIVGDEDNTVRLAASRSLGLISVYLEEAQLSDLVLDLIGSQGMNVDDTEGVSTAGRVLSLACVLQGGGRRVDEFREEVFSILKSAGEDDRLTVKMALASAMVVLCSVPSIETSAEQKAEYKSCVQYSVSHLCGTLRGLIMYSGSSDVRVQALLAVKQACKTAYGVVAQHLRLLLPVVIDATKEIDLRVKFAAERAAKYLIEGKGANASGGSTLFLQFVSRLEDAELARAIKDCQRRLTVSSAGTADRSDDEESTRNFEVLAIFGSA